MTRPISATFRLALLLGAFNAMPLAAQPASALPFGGEFHAAATTCENPRATVVWVAPMSARARSAQRQFQAIHQRGFNVLTVPAPTTDAIHDALLWLDIHHQTRCHAAGKTVLWGLYDAASAVLRAAYAERPQSAQLPIAVIALAALELPPLEMKRGDAALFLLHDTRAAELPNAKVIALTKAAHSRAIPVHLHQHISADGVTAPLDPFEVTFHKTPLIEHILHFVSAAVGHKPFKSRATRSESSK